MAPSNTPFTSTHEFELVNSFDELVKKFDKLVISFDKNNLFLYIVATLQENGNRVT